MRALRRLLVSIFILAGALAAAAVLAGILLRHPLPVGVRGPAADELAGAVGRAVRLDDWERTGAIRWTFRGRNRHLWDRRRNWARVSWSNLTVVLDLSRRRGHAFRSGREVDGAETQKLVDQAYGYWLNDSFWLNPVAKLFDSGVERSLVALPEGPALLIHYASGGLTPGDRYLWLLGPDGRPRAWRMWASALPIAGLEASWEGWTALATGALVATEHRVAILRVELSDVAGTATLAELEPGPDPFAALQTLR